MKIAYFTNHLGQTGVNQVVRDLVYVMNANGHECKVFYLKEVEKLVSFDCEVSKLNRVEELEGYDIIHTHGIWPELYLLKHLWHKFRNENGERTKQITTLHCYCFQDFLDLYGKLEGILLGLLYLLTKLPFGKVVCLSKDMMKYYNCYIPKRKLTYAYNTRIIDEPIPDLTKEEQCEINGIKGDGILIGMNCVLLYRKGIDVMLKAIALLPERYRLFVAGDGKERKTFEQMACELGVSDRVLFAGMKKDAFRYLPYYDIYALPSRSEGFPISLLEAAACSCKVVASRLPAVEECLSDEEIAKFDMPDEKALAEAILRIEDDDQMGRKLQTAYQEKYSPQRFCDRYAEIYGF